MKKKLINPKNGLPNFGLIDEPVELNIKNAVLKSKLGRKKPSFFKKQISDNSFLQD